MKLSTHSFLAKYYRFMFDGDLATNLCPLFWNTFFSILFFPFAVTTVFADRILYLDRAWTSTGFMRIFYGVLFWGFVVVLHTVGAMVILKSYFGNEFDVAVWIITNGWLYVALGFAAWLGAALALFLIIASVMLCVRYSDRLAEKRREKLSGMLLEMTPEQMDQYYVEQRAQKDTPSKWRAFWDTVMRKYCTKIEWK